MNTLSTPEIVEQLRQALEARDFSAFVDLFARDALFEVPFGLKETATIQNRQAIPKKR